VDVAANAFFIDYRKTRLKCGFITFFMAERCVKSTGWTYCGAAQGVSLSLSLIVQSK